MSWLRRGDRLSASEAAAVGEMLSQLARSGLPLETGLAAAAEELPRGDLARTLSAMSKSLTGGANMQAAFENLSGRLPAHLAALFTSGLQSGDLAVVLERYVHIHRQAASVRREVQASLAYPSLLFWLQFALYAFFSVAVLPGLAAMIQDFEIEIPARTRFLIWLGGSGRYAVVSLLVALGLGGVLVWRLRGTAAVSSGLCRVPVLGPLARWTALAWWARLMSLLLDRHLALPAALRLSGGACGDAHLAAGCDALASHVERGESLATGVSRLPQFPPSLHALLLWSESQGTLPEALDASAEIFEGRAHATLALFRAIVPPITFLFVVGSVMFLISAGVVPMLNLLEKLT